MDNSVHQLFVLFLGISCVLSAWEDGHDGVDRKNGDLPGMPITLNSTSPPSQCAKLCDMKSECKAWAYSKMNCDGQQQAPLCYLKAQVTAQSLNPCRVRQMISCFFISAILRYLVLRMQPSFLQSSSLYQWEPSNLKVVR